MIIQLTAIQARVIGVLMEKEVTTPDQYPLSLNALTLGCNQKSNRDPVMALDESEVQNALDELKELKQVSEQSGFGSRVVKYKHRFCNTEFGDLKLTRQQFAVVCVLLLRGAQTPGELRTRTNRLAQFSGVDEVEQVLDHLHQHNGEQIVVKLPREPGKRESRYMHLFCGEPDLNAMSQSTSSGATPANDTLLERVSSLEAEVADLKQQLAALKEALGVE
ncbi:YceH family protein [Aliiglaciecola litoralis]|uniref:YceH family protein n=1 Tax=Aliiglaciecola litoralis TaxID=582857 RepID=A0ABP3WV40_9ALTE